MAPRVAIVIYTLYGHIGKLAEGIQQGIKAAGGQAQIFQVKETLSDEVLTKMHAPPKPDYPNFEPAQMEEFDAFLFGIPTRYGNMPAQLKTFWDATGQIWQKGTLDGKYAGTFVSCSSAGGGTEMTALNMMSTFVHHGLIYVPLGYKNTFAQISSNSEVRGGSAWGAGTFAGDGSRQPTPLEMELAEIQGKTFWEKVSRVNF